MPLREVLAGLDNPAIDGTRDALIASVVFDSRQAAPGCLFVALRGGYVDGHRFLPDALRAGAVAALVNRDAPLASCEGYAAVVRVEDTRAALAVVAANFFGHPSRALRLVGVTGTDGKTTTSHMIDAICRGAGLSAGLIGTVEVRIGDWVDRHESRQTTPESLLVQDYLARMRAADVQVATLEATSHGLVMHRLDGCAFDVGVVTNITHEHLDFHGTLENYRAAKGRLFANVAESRRAGKLGVAIINADDAGALVMERYAAGCRILRYSTARPEVEVRATQIRNHGGGSAFDLWTPAGHAAVQLRLPGSYNVANALAAAGAAHALGIDPATIAAGLGALASVAGRMEEVDLGQPFRVLVDYAHTPEALRSVLLEARGLAGNRRVLTLFGSAGERDIAKRAIQGAVAAELADFAIFSSEDPRFEDPDAIIAAIAAGAEQAGARRGVHFDCIEDRQAAIIDIVSRARKGDVVVLAGKGHEHSMIYGAERRPWSDADAARVALRRLGHDAAPSESSSG